MLRSLHSAATGMTAQQNYIDVTSNNLANVNTAGFKKSRVNFQDLIYQIGRAPGVSTTQTTESPSGIQSVLVYAQRYQKSLLSAR